jgi:hypothetical protein
MGGEVGDVHKLNGAGGVLTAAKRREKKKKKMIMINKLT